MVLVDTSVRIHYLYGKEPYLTGLRQLLVDDKVVGHDLVYGELLMGDRGGRPYFWPCTSGFTTPGCCHTGKLPLL